MSTRASFRSRPNRSESWTTNLDRFGRVVIPKAAREVLGVAAGDELVLTVDAEGFRLIPRLESADLELRDGVLVFCGELLGPPEDAVAAAREERLRGLMGPGEP